MECRKLLDGNFRFADHSETSDISLNENLPVRMIIKLDVFTLSDDE